MEHSMSQQFGLIGPHGSANEAICMSDSSSRFHVRCSELQSLMLHLDNNADMFLCVGLTELDHSGSAR